MRDCRFITTEEYRQINISKRLFSQLSNYEHRYGRFRATFSGYYSKLHPYVNGNTGALLFENLYDAHTGELIAHSYWLNSSKAWDLVNLVKGDVYEFEARSQLYHTGRIHTAEIYRTTLELYRLMYVKEIEYIGTQPYPYISIIDCKVIDTHYKAIYDDVSHFFTTFNIFSREEQSKYIFQLVDTEYKQLFINKNGRLNCTYVKPRVMLLDSWNKLSDNEKALF